MLWSGLMGPVMIMGRPDYLLHVSVLNTDLNSYLELLMTWLHMYLYCFVCNIAVTEYCGLIIWFLMHPATTVVTYFFKVQLFDHLCARHAAAANHNFPWSTLTQAHQITQPTWSHTVGPVQLISWDPKRYNRCTALLVFVAVLVWCECSLTQS